MAPKSWFRGVRPIHFEATSMTFQISSLHLYNAEGEVRSINFRLNAVNVITGKSGTGKSAIVKIIDYCLGRSSYNIPGVINQAVHRYALVIQANDGQFVVSRPKPANGKKASSQYHIGPWTNADPPALADLPINSDLKTAKIFLSQLSEIDENRTETGTGVRSSFAVNIRNTVSVLLQSQGEVANESVLFHDADRDRVPQSIKDSLPYFLGATDVDYVALLTRKRTLRNKLQRIEMNLSEDRFVGTPKRALTLLTEATAVGLISQDEVDRSSGPIPALMKIRDEVGRQDHPSPTKDEDQLAELSKRGVELRSEFIRVKNERENLRGLLKDSHDFVEEVSQHVDRLESVTSLGLLDSTSTTTSCPVCSSTLHGELDVAMNIRSELQRVSSEVVSVSESRAKVRSLFEQAEAELASLNGQMMENKSAVESLISVDRVYQELRDRALMRSSTRGKVAFYLEALGAEADSSFLGAERDRLLAEIEAIDERIDIDDSKKRLDSALSRVSNHISEIARNLTLEYSDCPARLDIADLTVVVDTNEGAKGLSEIGSASNWLGYHIAALLGLHRFFIESGRPVPRFLVLDQPSQVWFPEEATDGSDLVNDEDRSSLVRFMGELFSFVSTSGGFQIIVLDHANLSEDWFQKSIIENWRGSSALVPVDWLDAENE